MDIYEIKEEQLIDCVKDFEDYNPGFNPTGLQNAISNGQLIREHGGYPRYFLNVDDKEMSITIVDNRELTEKLLEKNF